MVITVDNIRKRPFLYRSRDEQILILMKGRPLPQLKGFYSFAPTLCPPMQLIGSNKDVSKYDLIDWLTGCEIQQALYCWPCLLFNVHPSKWNTTGVKGKDIFLAIDEHKSCPSHIQAVFDKYVFMRKHLIGNPVSDTLFNELVRRNREILKRVIDVVCLLVSQKHPPVKGSHDDNQIKIEDCLENLRFLRDYDSLGDNIIEDAVDLLQISPNVVTDVIESMVGLVKDVIMKETRLSKFVSLILSVHGTNETNSHLSTVLRYIKNGLVYERFVGFQYFAEKNFRTSMEVLYHIDNVASEFLVKQKLISVAFDGGLPISKFTMHQLLTALSSQKPSLKFVPCYFHKLHYVLQQSVSVWNSCDCFFKTIKEIEFFLQQNSMIQTEFESFMINQKYPVQTFDFTCSSESLTYLKYCRKHFINYFNSIENISADDFVKVRGYCQFLNDFNTLFLIHLFIRLFSITDSLNKLLDKEMPEIASENDNITSVLTSLDIEKKCGFKYLWQEFIASCNTDSIQDIRCVEDFYRALHLDVVECIQFQISTRFEHFKGFEFFHLLNPYKISKYANYGILTSKLSKFYGSAFVIPLLIKETDILYKTFYGCISDKSMEQILQFLVEKCNNSFAFDNLTKLAELVLTLPCRPPSSIGSSIFDKINVWSCPGTVTGDISLLCIERDIFIELQRNFTFYDEVIHKFREKNKTLEMLDYKR